MMRLCDIAGCEREHYAIGYCRMHYNRRYQGCDDLRPGPIHQRDRQGWHEIPKRDNVTPRGPVAGLAAHYRPYPCPSTSDTTKTISEISCWRGNPDDADRVLSALESRDARRDQRDEDDGWRFVDGRWQVVGVAVHNARTLIVGHVDESLAAK